MDHLVDDILALYHLIRRASHPVHRGEITPEQYWLLRLLRRKNSIILFAAPRTLFTGGRLRLSSTGYCGSCVEKTRSALANWPKRLASPAVPLQLLANAWKRPGW